MGLNEQYFWKKKVFWFWKEINFAQHLLIAASVVRPIIVEVTSVKSSCLKVLYKLYISSIEQSGYHNVVTNSESYRLNIKDITALEKSKKGPKWID